MTSRAIGIDIGGTKIAAGVINLASGEMVTTLRQPTPVAKGGAAVLAACLELVDELDGPGDLAVGIGIPELVDRSGHPQSAYQFDWRDLDVRAAFGSRAVTIASDVRAAALAESRFGAGMNVPSLLFVTIGTGISSTFVLDGTPWAGARGNALVLASGDLAAINSADGVVVRSVLEDWAAGPALAATYARQGGRDDASTEEVLVLADNGDQVATEVVQRAAEALGSAIGQAVNLLDPDLVVLGGGLGLAGGRWGETLVAATRRSIWSDQTRELPIIPAALGTDAGMIGAALETCLTSGCRPSSETHTR